MWTLGKKIAVGVVGGVVLLAGIIMIFTPGPALVAIPLGLAILATEFEWARQLLRKVKKWIHDYREKRRAKRAARRENDGRG